MKPAPADAGATRIPPTELSMDISFELGSIVLLGMLALSAPPGLSTLLFRVLVKDGVPLDSQKFRHNHRIFSFFWLMMFLLGLFGILFGGNAAMPDRLQAGSITCAGSLIIVLSWFFLMLVLRRKLWTKRPDFTKAFPLHFFYLFHLVPGSWAVLLSWGLWLSWVALAPP